MKKAWSIAAGMTVLAVGVWGWMTSPAPEPGPENVKATAHVPAPDATAENERRDASATLAAKAVAKLEPLVAGGDNPFGQVDLVVLRRINEAMLRPEFVQMPRADMLDFFRAQGFMLQEEESGSADTGRRLVAQEAAPHAGIFNLSIQHVSDARGVQVFEGVRMSFLPEGGGFATLAESWELMAAPSWKPGLRTADTVVWLRNDGYSFWVKQYSDENPSSRPGPRNAVRMGLEPSQE